MGSLKLYVTFLYLWGTNQILLMHLYSSQNYGVTLQGKRSNNLLQN